MSQTITCVNDPFTRSGTSSTGSGNRQTDTGDTLDLGRIGEGGGLGPFAALFSDDDQANIAVAGTALEGVISAVLGIITIGASIWFLFNVVVGGLNWLSAGGDPKSLEGAQKRITNGVVGLIIVVAAWAIIGIAGAVLGLDILNPAQVIQNIVPLVSEQPQP